MYEIRVEHTFSAAHALTIGPAREPLHGHDWRVRVTIAGPALDADALLCDFHLVEAALKEICESFNNTTLNDAPPFAESSPGSINPSAEGVAAHIAHQLIASLGSALPRLARVKSVSVTEAPGCQATYFPPEGGA